MDEVLQHHRALPKPQHLPVQRHKRVQMHETRGGEQHTHGVGDGGDCREGGGMTPEEVRVLRGVRRRSRPPPRTPAGASERRDRGRGGPRTRLSFRPKILRKKGNKIPQMFVNECYTSYGRSHIAGELPGWGVTSHAWRRGASGVGDSYPSPTSGLVTEPLTPTNCGGVGHGASC